jgi:hypothetical protein
MKLGKLKMKLVFFIRKEFTFFEYARHTLASSGSFASDMMREFNTSPNTSHIDYFRTKNFYIQLLAAHSAAYCFYPSFQRLIPISLLADGLSEMIRGRDVGINAWTFDDVAIENELIEKYKVAFKRYYGGVMADCNEGSESVFNPEINEFTKLFMEDSIYLMECESGTAVNEMERFAVAHVIADIPVSVFSELSAKSLEYIA